MTNHAIPPSIVRNLPLERCVLVQWPNQEPGRLPYTRLRNACRCTKCRASQQRGEIPAVAEDIAVIGINNMGYGVQLVFNDGHDRGIFPWALLHEVAQTGPI